MATDVDVPIEDDATMEDDGTMLDDGTMVDGKMVGDGMIVDGMMVVALRGGMSCDLTRRMMASAARIVPAGSGVDVAFEHGATMTTFFLVGAWAGRRASGSW